MITDRKSESDNVEKAEVEITPKMIEVGLTAWLANTWDMDEVRMARAYLAMEKCRPK